MNMHGNVHFPVVQAIAFGAGLAILVFRGDNPKQNWSYELGKSLLWGGAFSALFAASGSC